MPAAKRKYSRAAQRGVRVEKCGASRDRFWSAAGSTPLLNSLLKNLRNTELDPQRRRRAMFGGPHKKSDQAPKERHVSLICGQMPLLRSYPVRFGQVLQTWRAYGAEMVFSTSC